MAINEKVKDTEKVDLDLEQLDKINDWVHEISCNSTISKELRNYILKKLMQKYAHTAKVKTSREQWKLY